MGSSNSKTKHSYTVSKSDTKSQQSSGSSSGSAKASVNETKVATAAKPAAAPAATPTSAPTPAAAAAPAPAAPPVPNINVDWIKESYFVEILKESVPKFSQIKSFKVAPALGPGENYASIMLRVKIDAELTDKSIKSLSYMMKIAHDTEQMKQMLAIGNFFITENEVYLDFLPKLEEMYREKGLDISIAPRAYRFKESLKVEPRLQNSVVMYDLGQDGFRNLSRRDCFNVEQSKVVIKKMAQYHAAGAHYKNLHGISEHLHYGMFGKDINSAMAILDAMMVPLQKQFLDSLKNLEDGHKYHDKMATYFAGMNDFFIKSAEHDPQEFNTVSHGDSWVNNFLFKLAPNGDIIDMNFVDFQNPHYGHPFSDLLYFIITSIQIEYKLSQFDYFIKYYHDQLIEHLDILGYTERKPRLSEFQRQIHKNGCWAVMGTFMVLPAILLDPTENATFENFLSDTEDGAAFKNLMYSNKRYQAYVSKILPWLDNRGLLELYEPLPGQTPVTKQSEVVIEVDPLTPAWVKIDDFKALLQAEKPDFKDITSYKVKNATDAGDNYSSILLSVDIEYATVNGGKASVAYMLKVQPAGETTKAILDLLVTFKREIAMYYEVLPQLEQLYQQAGESVSFGPKCFKFANAPNEDHILLENMRPAGFKNSDRLTGLNVEEVKHVLAKMAKLHAASAQLYATKGAYTDCLDKPLYTEKTRPIFEGEMSKSFTEIAIEGVRNLKGSEVFGDKVVKFLENQFDLTAKMEIYDKDQFNVLNHGDMWTNNILFAHDSQGKIRDTLLIDFQRSNFNSPAQDLYYFLLSSPNYDIKLEKFDYFIRYYQGELQRNLELLKYTRQIPTLRDLHVMLLKDSGWAISTTSSVMTAVLLDPTDNASIETMMASGEEGKKFKRKMFGNDRYRKHAELIYPFLNYRGTLDLD